MKKATRVEWSITAIIGCHGNERDACHVSITGEMAREMPREKERERIAPTPYICIYSCTLTDGEIEPVKRRLVD